jgi:hypothetical protein
LLQAYVESDQAAVNALMARQFRARGALDQDASHRDASDLDRPMALIVSS